MKKIIIPAGLIAVLILSAVSLSPPAAAENDTSKERKILFYRNPMNPAITSKVPAKDEMGMDYIPVYAPQERPMEKAMLPEAVASRVQIPLAEARRAGVKSEPLAKRRLFKHLRTTGIVAYDPQLAIAQEEFISSIKALEKISRSDIAEVRERAKGLVESAKKKLRLLGLSEEQIKQLQEKMKVQGNLVLPEERMWIYGDAYEYELPWLKQGQKVEVSSQSLPGEVFTGQIASINPVLEPKTRSLKFRAEIDNPGLSLKPQMYVDIIIRSSYRGPAGEEMVLAVPKDAVLDTGLKKIVWVDKGSAGYEGRMVELGPEAAAIADGQEQSFYPLLSGLREGEMVVTRANFLIDSQSQISGVSAAAYGGALGVEEKEPAPAHSH